MERMKEILKKFFSNKLNVITVVGVLMVVIIILIILFSNGGNEGFLFVSSDDERKFKKEYESLNGEVDPNSSNKFPEVKLPSSNLIKYSKIEDVLRIFNDDMDAVIYFGYSTCLYCRNAIQVLVDTAVNTELDEMLYLDIEDYWDVLQLDKTGKVVTEKKAHDRYYELLDVLGEELVIDYILKDEEGNEVKTGVKRIQYPLVVFVTDGRVVSYNIGTLFSQENPFVSMNEAQIRGLSVIYRYGIRDVVVSKKNKGLLK